ncbi:MAG: hypothetical protein WBG74_17275, partial [Shewanella sp.]
MEQVGIYEKLITQLIDKSIDRDVFYLGERALEGAEASVWLSRFLTKIMENAIAAIPSGANQLTEQIGLANKLVLWLNDHVQDDQ